MQTSYLEDLCSKCKNSSQRTHCCYYYVHVGVRFTVALYNNLLTSSHREYIFFLVPRAGLFSVKNQKQFQPLIIVFVNETKSGHPNKHLFSLTFRDKWLVFSLAQLDRRQALTQRPVIDQRPVEQTAFQREIKGLVIINLSLQFLGWHVEETCLE